MTLFSSKSGIMFEKGIGEDRLDEKRNAFSHKPQKQKKPGILFFACFCCYVTVNTVVSNICGAWSSFNIVATSSNILNIFKKVELKTEKKKTPQEKQPKAKLEAKLS